MPKNQIKLIKNEDIKDLNVEDVTFKNNKNSSIHRWYPYIEGFSETFVKAILNNYDKDTIIYDPFNGSGTTTLTAGYLGFKSYASEINPLMKFIAKTKVNTVKNIISKNKYNELLDIKSDFVKYTKMENEVIEKVKVEDYINDCYKDKNYFDYDVMKKIAFLKKQISKIKDNDINNILRIALASILVEVSNMTRASDLRRKKANELKKLRKNVFEKFNSRLNNITNDIKIIRKENINIKPMKFISNNAKLVNDNYVNSIDLVITSPPYVNGTNYFRNTKLELWILDFISKNTDLKSLRTNAITAGINNVSSRLSDINQFSFVEKYAKKLDVEANDKRIPKLVRAYFSDMDKLFKNLSLLLNDNGKIYFDIGDSQYYGVHVPVDKIINKISSKHGFELNSSNIIRTRTSRGGMELSQKLLIFEK